MDIQREILAFEERIALAKLEVKKAEERVAELEYQRSRFALEAYLLMQKEEQDAAAINNSNEQTGKHIAGNNTKC